MKQQGILVEDLLTVAMVRRSYFYVRLITPNVIDCLPFNHDAIHSLTSVVLPKPAGAEMRVNLQPEERPSFSRSTRRRRRTILDRSGGTNNFVPKIVIDIDQL
ncbi:MAG: hypothetical protein MUO40_08685 [Anaerolineaceae bacterium]|nr:hypothetical protein [Anaerolineaceae bacterium]